MKWIGYVAIALLVPTAFVMTYKTGHANALRDAVSECQQATISQLQSILSGAEQLTADANTASLALSKTISDRIVADAKTTKDIRDALKTTAHLRVDCVLPASVLRDLAAARHRANIAAATGIDSAVPTATGPGR